MYYTQNEKILQVGEENLIVGIDVGSEKHYARAFDWRGMAWWNTHPGDVHRKSKQIFICPVCGENFSAYASAKQRFCSRRCYGITKRGALHER